MDEMEILDDSGGPSIDCEFDENVSGSAETNQDNGSTPNRNRNHKRRQSPTANGTARSTRNGEHHHHHNHHNATNNDQLERCGRWLASIPRDDIAVLRQTNEFKDFLKAFERLGDAHLRVVVNNQATGPPPRERFSFFPDSVKNQMKNQKNDETFNNQASSEFDRKTSTSECAVASPVYSVNDALSNGDPQRMTTTTPTLRNGNKRASSRTRSSTPTASSGNVLKFTDDILFRILEFLRCRCLIQTSLTCSRFHKLVIKSATQRTYDIATARQLGNVMQLLRAREQLYYLDSDDSENEDTTAAAGGSNNDDDDDESEYASAAESGISSEDSEGENDDDDASMEDARSHETESSATQATRSSGLNPSRSVPVPALLPGRKILVTNAGDPEYNGVYYCTDCNGNGYVFTKPRFARNQPHSVAVVFDEETNPRRQNRVFGTIRRAGRLPLANANNINDNFQDDDDDNFQPLRPQQQQHTRQNRVATTPGHSRQSQRSAEESFQSGIPLRCVIAKAYSNHDILWYMSKEIEAPMDASTASNSTEEPHRQQLRRRKRTFSFWAPLMLSGNVPPELCVYPSQTSALRRQSQSWRSLFGTNGTQPPTLEVLD